MSQQEAQRMVYLFQLLQDQQKMIVDQISFIEKQINGVSISKTSMENLKDAKKDHEIILPLGTNAFVKATLSDPENVIIAVHKDICIQKSLDDGIISIQKNLDNYKGIQENLYKQLQDISSKLNQLRPQIEAMYRGGPQ
jgi:prefoldin alpha subunit